MNKLTLIITSILFLLLCLSCREPEYSKDNPNDIKALEEIKKEKWLEEAFITDADVLYISMKSNGKRQNGYALYICSILNNHQAKTPWVKIVEFGTANTPNAESAYGKLIGDCYCDHNIDNTLN